MAAARAESHVPVFRTGGHCFGAAAPAVLCTVKKKRWTHPYVDGELVRDVEYNETFVFSDRLDGFRAQHHPEKMRAATEDEKAAFERYERKDRP